jgi:serine/threonine-protein kinase
MGILTKHLLEPVIPPRQRNPKMGIPIDVEAVCLRALEKDRDKRWQDMDLFYRALGTAGGEPFETSGTYTPSPDVRFPVLAQPSPRARDGHAELAPAVTMPPTSPTGGHFDDERPVVRKAAGLKLGGAFVAVAIAAVLVVLALRPSSKPASTPAQAAVAPVAAPTPVTPPPTPEAKPAVEAKLPVGEAKGEGEEQKPAAEPKHAGHAKGHRSSADAVRDIEAKAGVEPPPAEKPASTTPAELKNPFGN